MAAKIPAKPIVFLSHSSSNRRELLGLKRLLDERAGGLIDFFLSSDDDSIAHGKIWPEEVRAALDRMSLMLIFVSTEALKSGWTYFEAGFGLHKLGSAKIYCLPGTEKGALPSPFNMLQNRNLHVARDISLLIKQCNEELGAKLQESVSRDEFERIFKKPLMVQLETSPSFERLVRTLVVPIIGPPNSGEIFSEVCKKRGLTSSKVPAEDPVIETCFSVGIRLKIDMPSLERESRELVVTEDYRKLGSMPIWKHSDDHWTDRRFQFCRPISMWPKVPVAEVEAYNTRIRTENEETRCTNEIEKSKPRKCEFELAPTNISVPVGIVDDWLVAANIEKPLVVEVYFHDEVHRESRIEAITSKLHGSELTLCADGSYLWKESVAVSISWIARKSWTNERKLDLEVRAANKGTLLSELHLQELVGALFERNIISYPTRTGSRRK